MKLILPLLFIALTSCSINRSIGKIPDRPIKHIIHTITPHKVEYRNGKYLLVAVGPARTVSANDLQEGKIIEVMH